MKVLVCDYAGISAQWLEQFAIKENLEVVGTITPDTDKKILAEKSWEYLLIFEKGTRQFFVTIAKFMNIPENRIVYALDFNSWATHPAAMYALLDANKETLVYRMFTFNVARQLNYFMSATTEDGLHYVATSNDVVIMRNMYISRRNWAEDEIKLFHALTKEFYHIDDNDGLFLDLGANIGTTGIYFTKKLAPNLKLLAFEPDWENFKLLRTNLILNEVENATVENYGLGFEESEMIMYRVPENPGFNSMYFHKKGDGRESETIKIITLDKYFDENKISPKDVKYIWIDTEGSEAQVLLGARNILTENPAPIFMEFNPNVWNESGYYENMFKLLKSVYKGWIWIREIVETSTINVRPIENLIEFKNSDLNGGNGMGDIFLIHEVK